MSDLVYGQLLMGAPGAGKTTYCKGMKQFFDAYDKRKCCFVNLDPATLDQSYLDDEEEEDGDGQQQVEVDKASEKKKKPSKSISSKKKNREKFKYDIDIGELIRLEDVSRNFNLGPNGGILYVFEFLETNVDWLINRMKYFIQEEKANYFIFDCPGQVELFTHHESLSNVIHRICSKSECPFDLRLCAIFMVDFSLVFDDFSRLVSASIIALNSMLRLELPHVNVLTKVDLVVKSSAEDVEENDIINENGSKKIGTWEEILDDCISKGLMGSRYGEINDDHDIDFMQNESAAVASTTNSRRAKYEKLNKAVYELVEEFNLVSYVGLSIQDKESIYNLLRTVDKAIGNFAALNNDNYSENGVNKNRDVFRMGGY